MTIDSIREHFERWRQYRKNVSELERLSDRQLEDIGISRGEILAIARKTAEARPAGRRPTQGRTYPGMVPSRA